VEIAGWLALFAVAVTFFILSSTQRAQADRLARRLRGLELRVEAIQKHLGIEPPRPTLTEWQKAALHGDKIPAIKLYREQTGAGLKEAKDAVENWLATSDL
jgi:hypothetical protein